MPARYTPPEQALKNFTDTPSLMPMMPEEDYDGVDMFDYVEQYRSELRDSEYILWSKNIEELNVEITPSRGYMYELTITFDRKIHTYITMLDIEEHTRIIKYYLQETLEKEIEDWYVAQEYHKQGIGVLKRKPPHYHMLIKVDSKIEPSELWNLNKAFNRHFGMNTFRPVEDISKYTKYMLKEIIQNTKEYKRPHLFKVE